MRTVPLPDDWREIRDRILERDGQQCAKCWRPGRYVDYVGDVTDFSDDNLQTLCEPHHREHCGRFHDAPRRNPRLRPPEPHPGRLSETHDFECGCETCTWWSGPVP